MPGPNRLMRQAFGQVIHRLELLYYNTPTGPVTVMSKLRANPAQATNVSNQVFLHAAFALHVQSRIPFGMSLFSPPGQFGQQGPPHGDTSPSWTQTATKVLVGGQPGLPTCDAAQDQGRNCLYNSVRQQPKGGGGDIIVPTSGMPDGSASARAATDSAGQKVSSSLSVAAAAV